jgi:epoxyqueuosine reductase
MKAMPQVDREDGTLPAGAVLDAARAVGFPLAGLARAERLDGAALTRWLAAGYAAGMTWMQDTAADRLDPGRVLPGARSVLALALPYHRPGRSRSPIARYARGRDYHYTHRDRLRALRRRLLELAPGLDTYACADSGLAMEKVWAERAGLGWIGKNGCLITPGHGSWVTLSVMLLDRAVDRYDEPHPSLCGDCVRCLGACPTAAFPSPGVVDARRCLAYHTIENHGLVPLSLRPRLTGRVFGCDVCQEVCPFNHRDLPAGDARFEPRPLGMMSAERIAALGPAEFARLSAGMAVVRARYDGLRRNALLALGAARRRRARTLVQELCDDPSEVVRDAARWALGRIER